MVNKKFIQLVKNLCKSSWKTSCKKRSNFCVKSYLVLNSCVKNILFTNFYPPFHQLLNRSSYPVDKLFYPLFHNPYYNNYLIFK